MRCEVRIEPTTDALDLVVLGAEALSIEPLEMGARLLAPDLGLPGLGRDEVQVVVEASALERAPTRCRSHQMPLQPPQMSIETAALCPTR